jgi:hypothetical protein
MCFTVASGTGSGLNARTDFRVVMASSTEICGLACMLRLDCRARGAFLCGRRPA